MPDEVEALVQELIADRLLSSRPDLDATQWKYILSMADHFAKQGPNKPARHVRRKLAVYQMVTDAATV